jgi:hypothetical protein
MFGMIRLGLEPTSELGVGTLAFALLVAPCGNWISPISLFPVTTTFFPDEPEHVFPIFDLVKNLNDCTVLL